MSEPKPTYQVELGSNGTAAEDKASASTLVTDGETRTAARRTGISPELRRLLQTNTSKPSSSEEPSEPPESPVSPDLLWLLSRPFDQGREVAIFKGQFTLTLMAEDGNAVDKEFPGGYYAIVPISPNHIHLQPGEVRFIRRKRHGHQ